MRYAYIFAFILLVACKAKQTITNKQSDERAGELVEKPIDNSSIQVTTILNAHQVLLDLVNVENDQVKVTFKPIPLKKETAIFYIPNIIPGTYSLDNYGQFVSNLTAVDNLGKKLAVKRLNDTSWQIENASKLHQITYLVDDTFDTESQHALFSAAGTNILKDKNFVLNLHGFVGYFKENQNKPYQVAILNDNALTPATSATLLKGINSEWSTNSTYDVDIFQFDRYATVIDHPVCYGYPDTQRFQLSEMEVSFSVYSPNRMHTVAELLPTVRKMMRAQRAFIGDIRTTNRYHILLYLSENNNSDASGFGALEHNNSTLLVLPEAYTKEKLEEQLVDIISHEFFHIITPLNIHSEEIHHFDYQKPEMSAHLWFYEGVTEYFAQLFQVQQKLVDEKVFFARMTEKLERSFNYQNDLSFTVMSTNIVKDAYQQQYENVYYKGALIAMCLDILIRKESYGKKGLHWLMQQLSTRYGPQQPFQDEVFISVIASYTTPKVHDFLQKHVVQGIPIDYTTFFDYVGLRYGLGTSTANYFQEEAGNSVIKIDQAKNQVLFQENVAKSNFFKNLGIQEGDVLVAVNGQKYDANNINFLIQISKKWLKGHPVISMINRNGENLIKETIIKDGINDFEKKLMPIHEKELTTSQIITKQNWLN